MTDTAPRKRRRQREINPHPPTLSPRAETTLHYIAQGLDNAAIAEAMGIHVKSVENYVNHIYQHLGLTEKKGLHARVWTALNYPLQGIETVGLPALVRFVVAAEESHEARARYEAAAAAFESARRELEKTMPMAIQIRIVPDNSRPRGMQL